jgi:hypothetical protein
MSAGFSNAYAKDIKIVAKEKISHARLFPPIDMVTNPRKTSMQRTFVFICIADKYVHIMFFFFFHILLLHCSVPGMLLNSNFIVLYPKFKLLSALVMQLKFVFFSR